MIPLYAFALILAAIISAIVAAFAWHRRSATGAKVLAILMVALTVWALTYSIRWLVVDRKAQFFWLDATYMGVVVVPTAFLILSIQFTHHDHTLNRRTLALFSIEPLLTLLLLWTDPLHGLFYAGNRSSGAILNGGIWFWVNAVYSYAIILVAIVLVIRAFIYAPLLYQRQAGILLFGMLLPFMGNIVSLAGFSPFPDLDITPFIFIGSGLIFMKGLLQYRLLDIVPIARAKLVERMNDGVIAVDKEGRIIDINSAARRIFGVTKPVIGEPCDAVFAPWPELRNSLSKNSEEIMEIRTPCEQHAEYEVQISPLIDRQQNLTGQLFLLRDITERKQTEEKLRRSEEQYRLLFENAIESIAVIQDARVAFCNPITCKLTGFSLDELKSRPFINFVHPDDRGLVMENYQKRLSGERAEKKYQFRMFRKNSRLIWVEISGIRIEWEGKPASLNFLIDITERKKVEIALKYQSTHDVLTGLYNRHYFENEIRRLQKSLRFPVSILVMDINGLKEVNDTRGHDAGDELLRQAAQVIKNSFRPEDVTARIGGDEFVVVMPETDANAAVEAISRVRSKLEEHNQSCHADQSLSFAIGYSTTGTENDLTDVLKQADRIMYIDKARSYVRAHTN